MNSGITALPSQRVVWRPAPPGRGLNLLHLERGDHSVAWLPRDAGEPIFVGLGEAAVVQTSGITRFREARERIQQALTNLVHEGESPTRVRFFGGAAFVPGRDGSGCWEAFGDAMFVLPRVTYVDFGERAYLAVVATDVSDEDPALEGEIAEILAHLEAPVAGAQASLSTAQLERKESTSETEWSAWIDSIRSGIRSGRYQKVVAARRSTLRLSPPPHPVRVLERLNELAPKCTRFALRIGVRTFVGATPERLIRREGREVSTEAIAGSIAADLPDGPEKLLSSKKDRAEHAYVVRAIESALGPLCDELKIAAEPELRRLRHILHLQTSVEGHLLQDTHVLDLTERLHPTPAVGGFPTDEALDWILQQESAERGWYASPVGWVDEAGDGEMVVALRSALINGDRVHLYAGAGIVDASDAASEYDETEVKLTGMRHALGLDLTSRP